MGSQPALSLSRSKKKTISFGKGAYAVAIEPAIPTQRDLFGYS
jgi:hypothetical protein